MTLEQIKKGQELKKKIDFLKECLSSCNTLQTRKLIFFPGVYGAIHFEGKQLFQAGKSEHIELEDDVFDFHDEVKDLLTSYLSATLTDTEKKLEEL